MVASRFFGNSLRVLQLVTSQVGGGWARVNRNDSRVCLLVLPWDEVRAFQQLPFPVLSEHGLSLDVAVQTLIFAVLRKPAGLQLPVGGWEWDPQLASLQKDGALGSQSKPHKE